MASEMGKKKKYFMVFLMFTVTIAILIYILKKIAEKRRAFLLQLAREKEERHAENAIMEEQEENKIKEMDEDKNMITDLTHYKMYQEFCPEILWTRYAIHTDLMKQRPDINALEYELPPAQVEILLYYQSFVKLFRLIIVSVKHLNCFITNDSNLLKLKLLLCRANGELNSEVSQTYAMHDSVIVEEKSSFHMQEEDFKEGSILYISVWSVDVFYRELLLGAISVDLSLYDKTVKQTIIENVLPVKQDRNIYGYLLVSLCHVPSVERLVCVVMSGRDLKDKIGEISLLNNAINPYVKVSLLNDGKLIKRHKTKVAIETRKPLFNEMIEYYIPEEQLKTVDILFLVMQRGADNSNKIIGKILVGSHGNGEFYDHWCDVISKPEQSTARWHPITR